MITKVENIMITNHLSPMTRTALVFLLTSASFLTAVPRTFALPMVNSQGTDFRNLQTLSPSLIAQSAQIAVTDLQGFKGVIQAIALSPNGKILLVATGDGNLTAISPSNNQALYSTPFDINSYSNIAVSPDGQIFAAAQQNGISVFRLDDGSKQMTLTGHVKAISSLAISPDNRTLVSSSQGEQNIRLWNLENGNLIETLAENVGSVSRVAFSPDGSYFVSGSISDYRYIKFWDTATGKLLNTYPQQNGYIYGVAITPDGKQLVAAVRNFVKVWDIATGKEILSLKASSLTINSLAMSPDGRTIATGNQDGTVTLFDISKKQNPIILREFQRPVFSVVFSPDGKLLYGGGEDKVVKIWQLNK